MHERGESIRWVRPTCPVGREQVRYTERLARSMGSDDDMFRIWSGPEGSSHKEPLSGIRIHRVHGLSFCAVLPSRAMLDAARHPGRQFVIQKAGHDQKVNALPFSCQLVRLGRRSLTLAQPAVLTTPLAPKTAPFSVLRTGRFCLPRLFEFPMQSGRRAPGARRSS